MKDLVRYLDKVQNEFIGFDNLFGNVEKYMGMGQSFPFDNMYTKGNKVTIEVAVAGFSKDELEVERLDNRVVIRGNQERIEKPEAGVVYHRKNIAKRSFEKLYTISNDYDEINTWLKDGILYIEMTKQNKVEERKLLEIK